MTIMFDVNFIPLFVVRSTLRQYSHTEYLLCCTGEVCDAPEGSNVGQEPDDWTPYNNRVEFELSEFLFTRNQMSAPHINELLNLWKATLIPHGAKAPFSSAADLYDKIDSTPLGDIPWQSFSQSYGGAKPEQDVPEWMERDYDTWFRDPRLLIQNILSNSGFDGEFDYAPVQEYDSKGQHRFHNFMSGDWCWRQAVC